MSATSSFDHCAIDGADGTRRMQALKRPAEALPGMRAHPTEAEKRLWAILRDRRLGAFKFRRQQIVTPYIVDFVCLEQRVIVEADGSQHADNKNDAPRDGFLRRQGFRLLRFWNNQVLHETGAVAEAIFSSLSVPHPPKPSAWAPPSSVKGEGSGAAHA